jgi:hypothetical protein
LRVICARVYHPRDLYDPFRFSNAGLTHDADLLRKLAVLFASTMDHHLRTYRMDRFKELDQKELERLLYPLLRADDRPTAAEIRKAVSPLLETVLDHKRELPFSPRELLSSCEPETLVSKR